MQFTDETKPHWRRTRLKSTNLLRLFQNFLCELLHQLISKSYRHFNVFPTEKLLLEKISAMYQLVVLKSVERFRSTLRKRDNQGHAIIVITRVRE